MKNGSNEISEVDITERTERAKKLYRYVNDVARRIDEAIPTSRSIVDLFSTQIEMQRQKLRDNCEKLMFLDPVNYGKKSLELLWRKVYYETVSAAKKLREFDNDCSYLFTHIISGIGHFHHLITRIQSETKVQSKELDYTSLLRDEETDDTNELPSDDSLHFGRFALHSCLVYLGDLSRYQAEIFHTFDTSIAARYYLQAAHIDMCLGMPYNQLGNLYLDKNYNLDSVCYYIHCLSCMTPFEGAVDNLTKIFQKNNQFYDNFNNSESSSQTEHIQNTIVNFISLIEIWYFGKDDTNIPQRCSSIAQELKIAMEFERTSLPDINKNYNEYVQAIEEENTNPSYLNGNLIHKIVQIGLFTLAKISETDEKKAFACKAFMLALLSQLLQKLLKQLELLGLKNPSYKYCPKTAHKYVLNLEQVEEEAKSANESSALVSKVTVDSNKEDDIHNDLLKNNITVDEGNKKLQNGEAKNNAKKLTAKRRRRRRFVSSESSEESDAETQSSEVGTDDSDSDETFSDSTYHSDGDSQSEGSYYQASDTDGENDVINGDTKVESISDDKIKENKDQNDITVTEMVMKKGSILDTEIKSDSKENDINIIGIQNFLLGDNFLPSLKLLQDWVLTEKDLILSCGDSGETFFQCVVDLLNISNFYFIKNNKKACTNNEPKILKYAKHLSRNLKLEFKSIPLPEDLNLRGTNICKFDKDAAEWQILDKYKPSVYEENAIRILNFIDFGTQIAKIVPRIRFNRSLKIFYLKKMSPIKLNAKINHKKTREWHNSKKHHAESSEGGLLRRLGRLWLASQVRELERSGQSQAVPALLALDAAALHKHLRRVKQLMRTRNFVLLVPTVVLQELDDLKRERSTARDAIRWLELQLRSGSRFLRAQRPGQSKPLPLLKYPRKAPPHVHNFIQILEFCNHFLGDDKQQQGGNGDPDNSLQGKATPLLILLIGDEPGGNEEQYKEFSLMGAAQAAGISVQSISDFYTKWRQNLHKSSKKR